MLVKNLKYLRYIGLSVRKNAKIKSCCIIDLINYELIILWNELFSFRSAANQD